MILKRPLMISRFYIHSIMICSIFFFTACSAPKITGYTTDPSRKEDKITPHEVYVELKVVTSDGTPLKGLNIKAETREYSEKGVSNSSGISRFTIKRIESEPIRFTFKNQNTHAIESLHHLPSKIKNVGLVFERSSNSKVRLAKYSLDGLHR